MMDALLDRDLLSDRAAFFLVAMFTAMCTEMAIFVGLVLK